jgi:hypothetical protein
MRSRSVTHDFFVTCWKLFETIQQSETSHGYPGARAVLAVGFRVRRRKLKIESGHIDSILRRYREGRIDAEQAIHEAGRSPQVDIVPELQANFAFTKAYVADADGSKVGLKGSAVFVDMSIFKATSPPWLRLGRQIHWQNSRVNLEAIFAEVQAVQERGHPDVGPDDVRDALEIAQHLAGDRNVLGALRDADYG